MKPSTELALVQIQFATPLGLMTAFASERGIRRLDFVKEQADSSVVAAGIGGDHPWLKQLVVELREYFAGQRQTFNVPLDPAGTTFELAAWDYLRSIPFGQTRSYAQQASAVATIRACRAVGGANGRNPLAIVTPCHRVIGADGSLTGYAGGVNRKRWLLEHERRVVGVGDLLDFAETAGASANRTSKSALSVVTA